MQRLGTTFFCLSLLIATPAWAGVVVVPDDGFDRTITPEIIAQMQQWAEWVGGILGSIVS